MKKKLLSLFTAALMAASLLVVMPAASAGAESVEATIYPKAINNIETKLRSSSSLVNTGSGYMRVYFDGDKTIGIEYYDAKFNITKKDSIPMELELWGGFYAGNDAYYVVEGQNNEAESTKAEVIRVIKYDVNWNKLGVAQISSDLSMDADIRYPFDYGCVEMAEHDKTLYIVTGQESFYDYNSPLKIGHQGFLMLAVDEETMNGKIIDCDHFHSFAQFIETEENNMYVLEQSEGAECTALSKFNCDDNERTNSICVLNYGGTRTSAVAVECYASVDDLAVSGNNILGLGTSIDQSQYDNVTSNTAHNIYLTVTPKSNFTYEATTVKWLTSYTGGGKCFYGAKITKINNNRFIVTWEEYEESTEMSGTDSLSTSVLHYVFVDGDGEKISKEYTAAAPISDCHPIVSGSKIVYYASNEIAVNFYTIETETGKFDKKTYQVVGDNATWDLINGVLTISGSGELYDYSYKYRYPVSSTLSGYSYSDSASSWTNFGDRIVEVIINEGIVSIGKKCFSGLYNSSRVIIKNGVKSISDMAFAYCNDDCQIIIPNSVTEIGEDIVWSGWYYYSGEHVNSATIRARSNSYAAEYAKNNSIRIIYLDGDVNIDYELNVKDMSMVYKHINKTEILTGEQFDIADVTLDGKVNVKDYSKIYKHINKTALLW